MIYTNTDRDIRKRNGMGKWMKDYSLSEKGKDWDYCIGLSYRSKMLKTQTAKKCWINLYNELHKLDNSVNGFVVDETDEMGIGIHHHLIVGSELDFNTFSKTVSKSWDKRGINWVERYVRNNKWDIVDYMCKHIGKTEKNVFDIFNHNSL
ncbi:MAG: hypothetical protein ISP56_05065 [Flavobacteriaceae bacterium]|nr:hypothetical protein [Flavobacteriaceae bacterium]